jgi:hypothetical protein
MNQPQDTGAFTTISGMIGGVMKAITVKPVLMAISFGTLTNVMVYAAASAAVGYVVKKVLDHLADRINAKCSQTLNSKDDE